MNMIKIDIKNGGNLIQEQEIDLMKEKLFIYQDLCVLLYADEFFNLERDFNNPFDLKKLDKKRAKIKYEKLRKELKL